jgi:glutamine amidotransferase
MIHALVHAPRSLRALSSKHRHGWGVATHTHSRWSLALGTQPAHEDPDFERACDQETQAWIAHVRLATVGNVQRENTHPFVRGRWCFAHNGTIRDTDFLARSTSRSRLDERQGSTDSELLFAYLLSRLDDDSLSDKPACARTDRAITEAVVAVTHRKDVGSLNFVLCDGRTLFVHRLGRTLSVHQEPQCFFAASEPWSDEYPWNTIREHTLLRVDLDDSQRVSVRTLHDG